MPQIIEMNGTEYEFPDTMSDEQIRAVLKRKLGGVPTTTKQVQPAAIPADVEQPQEQRSGMAGIGDAVRSELSNALAGAQGAGKRLIETGYNIGRGVVNAVEGQPVDASRNPGLEEALKPQNTPEKIGQVAADVGVFAATEGGLGLAMKAGALAKLPKIVKLGLETVKGATVGAGVTKAQGGSDEAAVTNAAIGGLAPVALAGLAATSKAIGNKILKTILKPSIQDAREGFTLGTIEKYDLGGSLNTMAEKTHAVIADRAAQLKAGLEDAKASGATVDLAAALADAEQELLANTPKLFGRSKRVANAIAEFTDDIGRIAPNGNADIVTAQQVKRATGNLGAWQYGSKDPDANAMEIVANAFYAKLRAAIEKAAPNAKIADLNAQLGELMPVENAIIRRIPVEARTNVLNLGRIIALASGNPALLGAEMALKSGLVGNALLKGAKAIPKAAAAKPVVEAAVSDRVDE